MENLPWLLKYFAPAAASAGQGWEPGSGALGWLFSPLMVAFWILLAVCAVGLLRWLRWASRRGPQLLAADRSLTLLRERYARGELDREQYRAIKRELAN